MQIQLVQSEIETAVHEYVANQGIKVEGKALTIKFQMTRGEQGLIGEILIEEPKPEATIASTVKTTRTPRTGTVGDTIAKVGEKNSASVNKLPTTASDAVAQANKSAEEDTSTSTKEVKEAVAQVEEESTVVVDEVKPAATTTSLFG